MGGGVLEGGFFGEVFDFWRGVFSLEDDFDDADYEGEKGKSVNCAENYDHPTPSILISTLFLFTRFPTPHRHLINRTQYNHHLRYHRTVRPCRQIPSLTLIPTHRPQTTPRLTSRQTPINPVIAVLKRGNKPSVPTNGQADRWSGGGAVKACLYPADG